MIRPDPIVLYIDDMNTKYKGIFGELIASIYLILKGFKIEARRFKTSCGEIDLIVSNDDSVVFVEVKSRKSLEKCFNAIHNKQLNRIFRASQIFLRNHPNLSNLQIRYDVIFISGWHLPKHLENVYWID